MAGKRPKIGDVLEVLASDDRIYLQYLGRDVTLGDCVLVRATAMRRRTDVAPDLFLDSYATFYPVGLAVRHGLAEVIGTLPVPPMPSRFRRRGAIANDGKVLTWIVSDLAGERVVRRLTRDERALAIAEVWNHEMLLLRVRQHWRPEQEG